MSQTGSKVSATLGDGSVVESDLFVAADGSGSAIRRKMLPDIEARYAGYVAWRGTLDESNVAPDLLPFFNDLFTFSEAPSGGHMLAYFIPGSDGAVAAGSRRLNWVWYVHVGLADLTPFEEKDDRSPSGNYRHQNNWACKRSPKTFTGPRWVL